VSLTAAPPAVEREVAEALEQHRFAAAQVLPISPFHGKKQGRFTFLAIAADGAKLKARRFPDVAGAERQEAFREGLEPAFAPVLARHGAVLIESWVEGSGIDGDASAAVLAEAGALLGRLHAEHPASGTDSRRDTSEYRHEAEQDLETLARAGAIAPGLEASIAAEVERLDPGGYEPVLIHRDFCAENFILDRDGHLVVIDNERFVLGAAGFDLGRSFHRWPMSERDWSRFLAAYHLAGGAPCELGFWTLITNVSLARIYARISERRLRPMLARLDRLGDRPRPA
jgi:hypothetical protein